VIQIDQVEVGHLSRTFLVRVHHLIEPIDVFLVFISQVLGPELRRRPAAGRDRYQSEYDERGSQNPREDTVQKVGRQHDETNSMMDPSVLIWILG
jgi:hypothetical protein